MATKTVIKDANLVSAPAFNRCHDKEGCFTVVRFRLSLSVLQLKLLYTVRKKRSHVQLLFLYFFLSSSSSG